MTNPNSELRAARKHRIAVAEARKAWEEQEEVAAKFWGRDARKLYDFSINGSDGGCDHYGGGNPVVGRGTFRVNYSELGD